MLDCNHIVAWYDFKLLGREPNHWILEIKKSLFIKRDRPSLNKNVYSQELFLLSFTMPILIALFIAIGYVVCEFSRLLFNSLRLVLMCT